ncbi:hypothetical protein KQX54_005567 [Cotesia glomerata]|uniref:Uncharacterized protein n=1 Tax=Cotesia glomerata TaxID=32391 RepID=A0AAV7IST6_COTGL|nr:hypothetical protein KQX54_005567 [Cotesia glomerata]
MWKRNLMAVYYLYDQKNSTVIFTLNPFASYAPVPWELIVEFVNDDDKKMTLYRLQYTKDPWVCQSITFDKTDRIENAKLEKEIYDITSAITSHECHANNRLYSEREDAKIIKQGYVKELADEIYDIYDQRLPIEATEYKHVDIIADYHEMTFSILTKKTNFLTVFNDVTITMYGSWLGQLCCSSCLRL